MMPAAAAWSLTGIVAIAFVAYVVLLQGSQEEKRHADFILTLWLVVVLLYFIVILVETRAVGWPKAKFLATWQVRQHMGAPAARQHTEEAIVPMKACATRSGKMP